MHWFVLSLVLVGHAAESFRGSSFYFGDPHVHTGVSKDGCSSDLGGERHCGAFEDVPVLAAEQGLDWLALADHVNGPLGADEEDFDRELEAILEWSELEGPLLIPAAEVWFRFRGEPLGHRNIYLFGDDEQLEDLRLEDTMPIESGIVEVESCDQIAAWLAGVDERFGPVLMVPHHPSLEAPMPVDFSCWDEDHEVAVEVYSAWGSSLGGVLEDWDPPVQPVEPTGTAAYAMDPDGLARRFAFMAGTDGHNTTPGDLCRPGGATHATSGGLSVLVLPDGEPLDRSAVHDAMVEGRAYATSGPMIAVDLEFWAGGSHLGGLGSELVVPEDRALEVVVTVPGAVGDSVREVLLVGPDGAWTLERTGTLGYSLEIHAADLPAWVYVALRLDGLDFYGERHLSVCDDKGSDDDEWIWMSPSWIEIGDALPSAGVVTPQAAESPMASRSARCSQGRVPQGLGGLLGLLVSAVALRRRAPARAI